MPDTRILGTNFIINETPAVIQAGVLHYYFLPEPGMWKPLLQQFRAGGFNAVMVPFPWSYHSPAEGFYDFTGPRDIRVLLDNIADTGLWFIPHIGPWIGPLMGAGGIPEWVWRTSQDSHTDRLNDIHYLRDAILRYIETWWNRLLSYFIQQSNHILTLVHPGFIASGVTLENDRGKLFALLRKCGLQTPIAWPIANQSSDINQPEELDFDSWKVYSDPSSGVDETVIKSEIPLLSLNRNKGSALALVGDTKLERYESTGDVYRHQMLQALHAGARLILYDIGQYGSQWGLWKSREAPRFFLDRVSAGIGQEKLKYFLCVRRTIIMTDILSRIITATPLPADIFTSPSDCLNGSFCSIHGAFVFLHSPNTDSCQVRLSLPVGDEILLSDEITCQSDSVLILPFNIELAGGVLKSTTMEIVLIYEIAGRTLCVIRNVNGGEVSLSLNFIPQHSRGDVRIDRSPEGWLVQFASGRLHSLVLDGPDTKLQILAFAPELADRVWPLDDNWRVAPYFPAKWSPSIDEPVRGVIIGPDLVVPGSDGKFAYQVSSSGYGYRWGPWRGSDPRTWLAPFSWKAPHSQVVPRLTWEVKQSMDEFLPDYPDAQWRLIPLNGTLAQEYYDVNGCYIWYRGYYQGCADHLVMNCFNDCDIFLNGNLIATVKTLFENNNGIKTIPLPQRYQQQDNSLVILVENTGRYPELDKAKQKHGLKLIKLSPDIPIVWKIRGGVLGETRNQGFYGFADWDQIPEKGLGYITWYRSFIHLDVQDSVVQSYFLNVKQATGKLNLYLNGVLIGRSGNNKKTQDMYWLPDGLLKMNGSDEILIMQWTRGAESYLGEISLVSDREKTWYYESLATR